MLRCHEVEERASAYLERDLPWRQHLAVRLHLLICRACRRYLAQLELMVRTLRLAGKRNEANRAGEDAVLARLLAERPRR